MPSVFLISDTHYGHAGVCRFTHNDDGVTKIRPWTDPDEMDEDMVKYWNDTVRPGDKVYHLGDVVINRKALSILSRLNGEKVLIKGNHDIFKLSDYTPYFKDIRAYHKLSDYILSHIPMHPDSLARWCGGNFHGHLHSNRVTLNTGKFDEVIDPRYFNVSVEQINFRPILFERAVELMKEQQGLVG